MQEPRVNGSQDRADEPVFSEPWQARAFALVVKLSDAGQFSWKEWSDELAAQLRTARDRNEPDDDAHYYEYWLAALERLLIAKGLFSDADMASLSPGAVRALSAPARKP